jgi:polysaccharide deacetylase 2 family uncharacterized protein YibQ
MNQKGITLSTEKQELEGRIVMSIPGTSNYEIMKNQMGSEFLKYDQENMIRKI